MLVLVLNAHRLARQQEMAKWQQRGIRAAEIRAKEEEGMIKSAREQLGILAALPQVRGASASECEMLFSNLHARFTRFYDCGLARTNGEIVCPARSREVMGALAGVAHFQEALRTRQMAMAPFKVDPVSGRFSRAFVYPVQDEKGEVCMALFGSLDLDLFSQRVSPFRYQLPSDAEWLITNPRGVVLVCSRDPQRRGGTLLPQRELVDRIRAHHHGFATAANEDGVLGLYAWTTMPSALLSQNVVLIFSMPLEVLQAGANRSLARRLTWLGVAGALALIVAWVGSDLFVLRQIRAIMACTARLASGDLAARTGLAHKKGELGQLANAFDRMIDALARRQEETAETQEALRRSEERYRQIVSTANEGIWVLDREFRTTFVNQRIAEMLGYSLGEMHGQKLDVFIFQEDMADYAQRVEYRRGGAHEQYECRLRRKDGQVVWALISATPIRNAQGEFDGSFAMLADITARKRAEEALRDFSGELLRMQDEERRRIARELHDHAAQWLAALSMNLTAMDSMSAQWNPKAKKLLSESLSLLEQCSLEVRTISYLLHPPLLDELGLAGAIEEYAEEFARRSGIDVRVELPPDLKRLPKEIEMAFFRVVQESLMNVHRHSGSPSATIRMTLGEMEAQLDIIDAGHGMGDPNQGGNVSAPQRLGVGVAGMRERLRQLGGRLEIESSPRGTVVRARVPLKNENYEHTANSVG